MKIIVDEMPFYPSECLFADEQYSEVICKLTQNKCSRFELPFRDRDLCKCECLTTLGPALKDIIAE